MKKAKNIFILILTCFVFAAIIAIFAGVSFATAQYFKGFVLFMIMIVLFILMIYLGTKLEDC